MQNTKPEKISLLKSILHGVLAVAVICVLFLLGTGIYFLHGQFFAFLFILALSLVIGLLTFIFLNSRNMATRQAEPIKAIMGREQARLGVLINSLNEAVFVVDRAGKIVLYNGAALEFLDTHTDIMNQSLDNILALRDSANKTVKVVEQALRQGKLVIHEDLVYHLGNRMIDVYVTANPILNHDQSEGALVLVRDISRQKTLEAQKDEFISIISHELRTPVAVVEADLSTLLMPGFTDLPDKALKLIRSAQSNLVFLQTLLQDLSELSQADRSVLDIELNQVEPVAIINEVVKDLEPRAREAGIVIKTEIANGLPAIFSSGERLKEILVNLVTNAVKYSGNGRAVTITARPSIKIQNGVQLSVSDQGIGMSQEDQDKLFAKFFRAENKATQSVKGTGMGLYISKKQADRIGAKIWLQSKLNAGSTFYLEVPPKMPSNHATQADT